MSLLFILLQVASLFNIDVTPDVPESTPNIYLSADEGGHWATFTRGLSDGDTANDVFELGNTLFLSTRPFGLYRMQLDEDDRCWERVTNGLPGDLLVSSLVRNGDHLVMGTFDQGIYISSNSGQSWRRPIFNIKSQIRALIYTETDLIAATEAGIFHSLDNGQTWLQQEKIYQINDFTYHNGKLLAIGQNRIGILINGEVEWSDQNTYTAIRELMPHQGYLYFRTAEGKMHRTKDGLNWEQPEKKNFVNFPRGPMPEALFTGYQSTLPQQKFGKNLLRQTSFGWISIRREGC